MARGLTFFCWEKMSRQGLRQKRYPCVVCCGVRTLGLAKDRLLSLYVGIKPERERDFVLGFGLDAAPIFIIFHLHLFSPLTITMPARRSYATKWADKDSLLLVHNHRIVDSTLLQKMDVSRRTRSTPIITKASTPAVDREFVAMIANSKAKNTTTAISKSKEVAEINLEENTVEEARDEQCNYEAVPAPHVGGDEKHKERDDGIEASPVYWSVEYERQENENCSTPSIDKKDSAVDSGASSDLTEWMNSAKQSVSSNKSSSSTSSSSKKSKEISKAEVKTMMAAMSTTVEDELDLLVKNSGMESGTFDKTGIKSVSRSLPSIAKEKSSSNDSMEDGKTSGSIAARSAQPTVASNESLASVEVVFVDSPSDKCSFKTEEESDFGRLNMATEEDTTKQLEEDITRSSDLHLLVSKLWTAAVDANLFDDQVAESISQRKNIVTTIGDNAKLSKSLSLTKKMLLEDVKSTLVKSKTATERFAKLFQKTAKSRSENESGIIQGNDSFETDMSNKSTTSSWIASRRSAVSEKSTTSTVLSKKLERIVKAENESADHLTIDRYDITPNFLESVKSLESVEICLDSTALLRRNSSIRADMISNEDLELVKICVANVPSLQDNPDEQIIADKFSIQDDVSNEVMSVMTEACEEEQSTPTIDQVDKSIVSLLIKKTHLYNGSSKIATTVKKSILNNAHKARKSRMIQGRIVKRSIEVNKEVGRGDQCEELNIECQGSVEGAMSNTSNKTNSSKKSTKSIAEIYQEYRGANNSTPRAKNTRHHKTLLPTTKTVPEVEAVTTAKVATPTNQETPTSGNKALKTKMSTMSHSSGVSSVTSKGQSQIAPDEVQLPAAKDEVSTSVQIAPEEVQLPATENVASSSENVASHQRTPGKFWVAINVGVFNCVCGADFDG